MRLGDRVRWTNPPTGFEEVSLAGFVIGLNRRFPLSPDLALDFVHVQFDELTLDGSHKLWVDSIAVEAIAKDDRLGRPGQWVFR